LVQLTGRRNYEAYSAAIGVGIANGDGYRRLTEEPGLAVDVACWFWQTHGLNVLADQDDVVAVTRRINGGLNRLADRQRLLTRTKFFLRA
jgi:putative chitinase